MAHPSRQPDPPASAVTRVRPGACALLAALLQSAAAAGVALPVLLLTLGAFTETWPHLLPPAGLQLLLDLPAALALVVAARYVRDGGLCWGLARWARWGVSVGFAVFGGVLLLAGLQAVLIAL